MPCNKETNRCIINYKHEPLPNCCKNNLKEILMMIDDLFNKNDIPYWLDYGTLLGAVREGDILSNDEDCDIGILNGDVEKVLSLSTEIRNLGFQNYTYGYPDGMNISYSITNSLHVDIFFWDLKMVNFKYMWEPEENYKKRICLTRKNFYPSDSFKGRDIPPEILFPREKIKLGDYEYWCPKNPENFVQFRYGLDWRIPKII